MLLISFSVEGSKKRTYPPRLSIMIRPAVPVELFGSGAADMMDAAATARTINNVQAVFLFIFAPLLIPMHRLHRKRRQAHCDVLRSTLFRRAVLNPFALMRNHGLSYP